MRVLRVRLYEDTLMIDLQKKMTSFCLSHQSRCRLAQKIRSEKQKQDLIMSSMEKTSFKSKRRGVWSSQWDFYKHFMPLTDLSCKLAGHNGTKSAADEHVTLCFLTLISATSTHNQELLTVCDFCLQEHNKRTLID